LDSLQVRNPSLQRATRAASSRWAPRKIRSAGDGLAVPPAPGIWSKPRPKPSASRGFRNIRCGIGPHLLLLAAVTLWGWTFIATKILLAEIGPVDIFALRLGIALPLLLVILAVRRRPWDLTRADWVPITAAGGIFAFHFVIQLTGLRSTTATNTGWIIAFTPLTLAVLSWLVLREPIGRGIAGGIAVATIGIVLLVSRGNPADLGWVRSVGDWLILLSTLTWAIYTVTTRNVVTRRDPLAVTFGISAAAAAFIAVPFVANADAGGILSLSSRGIASLLYLAVAGSVAGQWFWQVGVARLGAARAGLYLYVEPLATLALAVPVLGEPFGWVVVVGGLLVLVGVYLGQRR
jgi:drug/metabolite transporter (DMT)-like permease